MILVKNKNHKRHLTYGCISLSLYGNDGNELHVLSKNQCKLVMEVEEILSQSFQSF